MAKIDCMNDKGRDRVNMWHDKGTEYNNNNNHNNNHNNNNKGERLEPHLMRNKANKRSLGIEQMHAVNDLVLSHAHLNHKHQSQRAK